jgi:hypothetical protein
VLSVTFQQTPYGVTAVIHHPAADILPPGTTVTVGTGLSLYLSVAAAFKQKTTSYHYSVSMTELHNCIRDVFRNLTDEA